MRNRIPLIFLLLLIVAACQYSTETYKEGKSLFDFQCAPCHGIKGEGFGTLYPNLYHLDFIKENRKFITCWIQKGIGPDSTNAQPTRFSDQTMPPMKFLSDIDICNILNYANSRWWKMEPFTLQEINQNIETSCNYLKNEMRQPLKAK